MANEKGKMCILVACEESQAVTIAFRKKGHLAFSCDLLPCSGGHPEWHIQGDVLPMLNGNCFFRTVDGETHSLYGKWDMIIAHPPCTYLTPAGAANIPLDPTRLYKGYEAAAFFKMILDADCDKIAVENPPPMKRFNLPCYTQLTRPWMFGDRNNKPVAWWLKGLPPLQPTTTVEPDRDMVRWVHKATGKPKSCSRWYNTNTKDHSRHQSKTWPGMAAAMADQWG